MRGQTLMAIGKAIVTIQRDFFASGDKADIKPMILKDVAALTGLDLSVISRATAGKYILTPTANTRSNSSSMNAQTQAVMSPRTPYFRLSTT